MMLSFEKRKMLSEIFAFEQEELNQFITELIINYASINVDNAYVLLQLIPNIVQKILEHCNEKVKKYRLSSELLMTQRLSKSQDRSFFAMMVPICKTMFPDGIVVRGSKAETDYFDLFLKLLSDKKIFSWEKDEDWARMFDYTDYLKKVERSNYLACDEEQIKLKKDDH